MIVPMHKVHLAARSRDREQLVEALRDLGVLHLVPVEPSRAVADEQTARRIDALEGGLRVLSNIVPGGSVLSLSSSDAAHEAIDIQRRAAEGRNRLAALYHELEQIAEWGNLQLKHLEELREAGIDVRLYAMPRKAVRSIEAECAEIVARLPNRNVLVAVVDRDGGAKLPPEAAIVLLPPRDAPSIRAEAAELDATLRRDARRLHELACLVPQMRAELVRLQQQADDAVALHSAAADEHLFAMQGWAPRETAVTLGSQLAARGIPVALEAREPTPDEQPPSLVRIPAWARPIEGLFQMLGTIPGYREPDVSLSFLLALPIFTAMLISDGGYGALLLALLMVYRRVAKAIGARFTQLLIVVGAVSLVWGIATSSFFGFSPYRPLISVDVSEASRVLMMRLSFTLGAIHLCIAQGWQAVRLYPDLRFLSKIGWALFIWGMYGVVKMFVLKDPMGWDTPWPYLLWAGAAPAILFASPSRNIVKTFVLGVARFPLPMLSAFSDVISYVRLMAVGLASSVLAASFNDMALSFDSCLPAAAVLLSGHALNMGLALIAMFAHGVRLNMLEFSSNLGMQWTGYSYHPFTRRIFEEHTQ